MTIIASTSVSPTRDSTAPALAWMRSAWPATSTSPCSPANDLVKHAGQMALVFDPVEEDHELVAAEAADLGAVAGKGGKPFGDRIDQPVADRMSERVVDALEVVEVEDGQPAEPASVAGRHGLGDEFVEIGAVGAARSGCHSAPWSGSSPPPRRAG